ncbi:hypothetical protein LINPERHAP1_LOCUS30813 [Linum perenne]
MKGSLRRPTLQRRVLHFDQSTGLAWCWMHPRRVPAPWRRIQPEGMWMLPGTQDRIIGLPLIRMELWILRQGRRLLGD